MRHFATLLVLLVASVTGCGGGGDGAVGPGGPVGPGGDNGLSATGNPASLLLSLELAPLTARERYRLPPAADAFQVQIYSSQRRLLQERSIGRVGTLTVDNLPNEPVLVRLLAFAGGQSLGYFDRSLELIAGQNSVTFDTLLAGSAPDPAVNLSAEPERLAFLVHPQDTTVGTSQTLELVTLSAAGVRLPSSETATLSGAGASFSAGPNAATNLTVDVSFEQPADEVVLTASATGLAAAQSLPFQVVGGSPGPQPGPLATGAPRLSFVTAPSSGIQLQPFTPFFQVELLDAQGRSAGISTDVSVALSGQPAPPTGAQLRGPTTQTSVQGLAGFVGLDITQPGTYRLLFSAPGYPDLLSPEITIAPAAVAAPSGRIYVIDQSQDRIRSLTDPRSLTGVQVPLNTVQITPAIFGPDTIVVDTARDRAYVSTESARVLIYNQISTRDGTLAADEVVNITGGGSTQWGLHLDQAHDRLFFTSDTRIDVLDNASTLTTSSRAADRTITGFDNVRAIAGDSRGRLLALDITTDTLVVIPNAGTADGGLAAVGAIFLTGFSDETGGIDVNAAGTEAYVADLFGNQIVTVDVANPVAGPANILRTIAGGSTALASPRGLFFDSARAEFYVASGAEVLVFGASDSGDVAPRRRFGFDPAGVITADMFVDFTRN